MLPNPDISLAPDTIARHALRFPRHGGRLHAMCNLYSITKGQQAIRDLPGAMRDLKGDLPMLPGRHPIGQ